MVRLDCTDYRWSAQLSSISCIINVNFRSRPVAHPRRRPRVHQASVQVGGQWPQQAEASEELQVQEAALPRLLHRGWVSVAKAVQDGALRAGTLVVVGLGLVRRHQSQETKDQDGLQGRAQVQDRGRDGQAVRQQETEGPAQVGIRYFSNLFILSTVI